MIEERECWAVRGESSSVSLNLARKKQEPRFSHLYSMWRGRGCPLKGLSLPFTLDSTRMNFSHLKYLQNGPKGKKITGTRSHVSMGRVGVGMSGADTSVSAVGHRLEVSPCLSLAPDSLFLPGV